MINELLSKLNHQLIPQQTRWGKLILTSSATVVAILGSLGRAASAQPILACQGLGQDEQVVSNLAQFQYDALIQNEITTITGKSDKIEMILSQESLQLALVAQGIRDSNGNTLVDLGTVVDSLTPILEELNLSSEQMEAVTFAAIEAVVSVGDNNSLAGAIAQIKSAMAEALPKSAQPERIGDLNDAQLGLILLGFGTSTLKAMGLDPSTAVTVNQTAQDIIPPLISNGTINTAEQQLTSITANLLSEEEKQQFQTARNIWTDTLATIRNGQSNGFKSGDTLQYVFTLKNTNSGSGDVTLPPLNTWQQAITGQGNIKSITYKRSGAQEEVVSLGTTAETVSLQGNENLEVTATITVSQGQAETASQVQFNLSGNANCGFDKVRQTVVSVSPPAELGDPFGQLTGCNGEILPDYRGFRVGLYKPAGGSEIGEAVSLTRTELPDNPNNSIPAGLEPNIENSNPFFLTNQDAGKYNFLLDIERGQLDNGDTYILLVDPPEDSIYEERRLRIEIGERSDDRIPFTATSLDGEPISVVDPLQRTIIEDTFVVVEDAERLGLNLAVIDFQTSTCQAEEVNLDKFADRAAADIGDIVLYQLNIQNLSQDPVSSLTVTDTLPAGLNFISESVRVGIGENEQTVAIEQNQQTIDFQFTTPPQLPSGETLSIVYAAEVTPDAMRGSGVNTASVEAQVRDRVVRDGPVTHELEIRPGILNDCGTLIGRVFVDKNFDGEQQTGEPGVPNAVIYLEDGTRITTDANGLYSLKNVCPGLHTGILDLTSIPDYQLVPNPRRREQQSPSRLFKMSPGGMVRLNFAVTPTAEEEQE